MKLSGIQVMQFLGMVVAPMVIGPTAGTKESAVVWSCVVIALLFIGVSICSLANAIAERDSKGRKWTQ